MDRVAEQKLAQAAGVPVPKERRFRQGAQAFGAVCFAWYHDRPWAGLIREKEAETIAAAMFDGTGCEQTEKGGRNRLLRFPLEEGAGVLRHYRRGGAVRLLMRDSYLMQNRPYRELRVQALLYGKGFPVPEPLGAVWRRSKAMYRGAIASREIDGQDLYHYLATAPPDAESVMERVGALVRRMHDLGVYHADLQVKNVLVAGNDLYVIDFDNARIHDDLSERRRARNLLRFRRSLQKNGFPDLYFGAFLRGYGEIQLPGWLDRMYRLKGWGSDLMGGKKPHA